MLIETRVLGKRKRLLDDWSVELPPGSAESGDGGITLRDLITRIVHAQVRAFTERERVRRFVRVLSDREIAEGEARGKVDSGGREPTGPVEAEQAVGAALQGFQDGLYLVILDGEEQRDLDRQVFVSPDSRVVFLRLTFLAGA